MRLVVIAALGVLGCGFRAGYDDTHYRCGLDERCPEGYACVAGACVAGAPDAMPDVAPGAPDAAPPAIRCGSMNLLVDDFATSTASPLWQPLADAPVAWSQTGGALVITLPAGTVERYAGFRSTYAYDLTGAQLAATVAQVGGKFTILELRGLGNVRAQLVVDQGMIGAAVFGVADEGTRVEVAYDPAVHVVWRMREDQGELYWETSPNGATWTTLWHEPMPFPAAHVRAAVAAGGQLATAGVAKFADVNLGAPAAPGFCAGTTLIDDFTALDARWSAWADGAGTVQVTDGAVVLTSPAGSVNYSGIDSEHLYDLTTGGVYVDADQVATGASHVSFFQAVLPGDGQTRIEIDRDGDTLQFQQWVAGTAVTDFQFPYTTADRYWRLRVDNGLVKLGTSADAASWVEHTNAAVGFDARAVHVVLGAGHYASGGAAVVARFGGINTP